MNEKTSWACAAPGVAGVHPQILVTEAGWIFPPATAPISDVILTLKHARGLISEGWTQGQFWAEINGQQSYCAVGAVRTAVHTVIPDHTLGTTSLYNDTIQRIYALVGKDGIAMYNDHPGTTKSDVLHLFDLAILRAQCEETP